MNGKGDFRLGGYEAQKLEDVRDRVANIEGQMKSLATKTDVASAKVSNPHSLVWGSGNPFCCCGNSIGECPHKIAVTGMPNDSKKHRDTHISLHPIKYCFWRIGRVH